jgi:hypothetical protein
MTPSHAQASVRASGIRHHDLSKPIVIRTVLGGVGSHVVS